ncbi:MAG TPA: PQQ-binding-like beta-propeller repeat protein [Blastocatellia bacterium]|nr:PQQ-binding-like beta-propeller repeat protein [Blastocatellia bacterium]
MPIRLASSLLIAILILSPAFTVRSVGQSADGSRQSIIWTNTVNCAVTGNSLYKTAGRDDTSDAGARSLQSITAGDAFFEFTVAEANKTLFCGLTHAAIGTDFAEIDFAIKLTSFNVAEVRENDVYKTDVTYKTGDVFRIADEAGVMKYYKNDTLFYTSIKPPTYPLIVDATLLMVGARIDNAVMGALALNAAAEWKMYQRDPAHTAFAVGSKINTSNASSLNESWSFATDGGVTGTPIVSGGTVYVGSWDGRMYALRESDGSLLWSYMTEQVTDNCGSTYGIDSTAAISNGRLYFGSAACNLYSLDAATGNLIWRAPLADATRGWHLWSSPLVFDGKIYVGLASHCDHPCVRGTVVCVDASNGKVIWTSYTAPQDSTGAGVWSSFAVDPARRLVYATSGNFCEGVDTQGDSIVAFNADTGALAWSYKNAARDRDGENFDFGASPVLFDIGGSALLAAGSKDGHCYAVNRATGELIWDTAVTDGNTGGGIIGSPAAAYGKVFMGTVAGGNTRGKVVALDQRTGNIVWQAEQSALVIGAAAVSGGAVFIGGADGGLRAYDAETGALLWTAKRGSMLGGVSITSDRVFIGSLDKSVYSFALNTTATQPRGSIKTTSPVAGDEWIKGKKHTIRWVAGAGINKVDVSISRDGGITWSLVADDIDASLGAVKVKAKKPKSESVIVQVTDSANAAVYGQSGAFRIR